MLKNTKAVRLSGWFFKSFVRFYRRSEIVVALPFPGSPATATALEVLTIMGGKVLIVIRRVRAIHPELNVG